ncbi:hypothetical protein LOAG_00473 [Loa loa]|uniref:Transmembrane protein 107 n=1 Tax=Loa loa TaxID=7209 RepID=A0A1I7VN50_LOALO|nr:hypothetical protein LOAG_00473 [Loa loa]EFO27997.2 hypothetical protein LOAG_00473 [Loa loa]
MNASSAYFVTIVAHGTMLVMALSEMNEYVMATLPLTDWTEREYADVETSLTVAISLGIACCVTEVVLLTFQLHTFTKAIFSMCLHLLATIFLLKFIVDSHPLYHFWIVFGIFSVPAMLIACLNPCMNFKLKEHC